MTNHPKWIPGEVFAEEKYLLPQNAKFALIIRFELIEEESTSAVSVVHVSKTLSDATRRDLSDFAAVIIVSGRGQIGLAHIGAEKIEEIIWTQHTNFRFLANALTEVA